mgnify:CR=1 FL=1
MFYAWRARRGIPVSKNRNWIYNDYERAAMEALGIDLPGTIAV